MPVVLLPARSRNLAVTGLLSKHWPRWSSQSALQMVGMMRLCLVADGVINNEDHSSPRQLREERREQLSSHKSNQKREHGLLVQQDRVSLSVRPTVNILTFLPWLLRTEGARSRAKSYSASMIMLKTSQTCFYSGSLWLLALTLVVDPSHCYQHKMYKIFSMTIKLAFVSLPAPRLSSRRISTRTTLKCTLFTKSSPNSKFSQPAIPTPDVVSWWHLTPQL